jgi:hypothetical protein
MKKCLLSSAFLALLLASLGCEKTVPAQKRAKVTGSVNYDGKPLVSGNITFDLKNGEPPASFGIVDGKFDGMAPIGKNMVAITSFRKISMKEKMGMDGPGYDQPVDENMLPARYSTDSKLEKEVTEKGPNDFTFDLKKN